MVRMDLVEKFHQVNKLHHSTVNSKAFSEKGLTMLATIFKSSQATEATISIVETCSKIRNLSRSIEKLSAIQDEPAQQSLMQKSGKRIAEILDDDLAVTDSETSIELNFAVLKFKQTNKEEK